MLDWLWTGALLMQVSNPPSPIYVNGDGLSPERQVLKCIQLYYLVRYFSRETSKFIHLNKANEQEKKRVVVHSWFWVVATVGLTEANNLTCLATLTAPAS